MSAEQFAQVFERMQLLTNEMQSQQQLAQQQGLQLQTLGAANAALTAQLAAAQLAAVQAVVPPVGLVQADGVGIIALHRQLRDVKLTPFTGLDLVRKPVRSYLFETYVKFDAAGIDPDLPENASAVIKLITASFTEAASLWVRGIVKDDPSKPIATSFGELKSALLTRFCPHDEEEAGYEAFERVVQKGQLKLGVIGYNREMLTASLVCQDMSEKEFMHAYKRGLTPANRKFLASTAAALGNLTQAATMGLFERIDEADPSESSSSYMGPPANKYSNQSSSASPMELNMIDTKTGTGGHLYRSDWEDWSAYQAPRWSREDTSEAHRQHNLNAVYRHPQARNDRVPPPRNNFSDRSPFAFPTQGQPKGPMLDFSHLPEEFRAPFVPGEPGRLMREKCVRHKRCTYCRELLSDPHNPLCPIGKKN